MQIGPTRRSHLLIIVLLWLFVHVTLFSLYGIRSTVDAHRYLRAADTLLEKGMLEDVSYTFYIVHISVLGLFRILVPDAVLPILVFQSVVSLIAVFALYRASQNLFKNDFAGLASALVFLLWFDQIHWNLTAMTESLFCSTVCFLLASMVNFDGSFIRAAVIVFLAGLTFFIRPTGIVVVVGTMAFFIAWYREYLLANSILKWTVVTVALMLLFVGSHVMLKMWDFTDQYARGNIVTYADTLTGEELNVPGLRIDVSDTAWLRSPRHPLVKIAGYAVRNPLEFLKTATLKIIYLVLGVRPYYSWYHNIYNIIWLMAIYVACYLGYKASARKPVLLFAMTVIVANCVLIGISSVDWDNRFYIPMLPGIAMAGGGGLSVLYNVVCKRFGF